MCSTAKWSKRETQRTTELQATGVKVWGVSRDEWRRGFSSMADGCNQADFAESPGLAATPG